MAKEVKEAKMGSLTVDSAKSSDRLLNECSTVYMPSHFTSNGKTKEAKVWLVAVNEPWFSFIRNGEKKYEGRRFTASIKKFKIGDHIRFQLYCPERSKVDEKHSFIKKIKGIHHFPTFEKAMTTLPLNDILPGVATVAEGKDIYYKFVSQTTQETDGVVMIEVIDL